MAGLLLATCCFFVMRSACAFSYNLHFIKYYNNIQRHSNRIRQAHLLTGGNNASYYKCGASGAGYALQKQQQQQ